MGKYKIGFFPGVWDLVHAGHVMAFEEAKRQCDYLIVGVQIDPVVDRLDKRRPIMSLDERCRILRSNKFIDSVIIYGTEYDLQNLDQWLPYNVRFIGADHKGKLWLKIKKPIIYVKRNHNYSSTELRRRIYEAEKNSYHGK